MSDSLTDNEILRLEEQAIDSTRKYVRGYQVPWTGAFDLTHTGGAWVSIEPMGTETRIVTETVEVVAGAASLSYPVYGLAAYTWLQVDLGAIDFEENGTVSSAVSGQSLATVTYTTRCKKWLVTDGRAEQLQLVLRRNKWRQ